MNTLYRTIVGGYGVSSNEFYDLLLTEAQLIIKGHRQEEEKQFNLMSIAMINAIGQTFGDSKFKAIDPFKDNKKESKPKKTREDLLAELQEIKSKFKRNN